MATGRGGDGPGEAPRGTVDDDTDPALALDTGESLDGMAEPFAVTPRELTGPPPAAELVGSKAAALSEIASHGARVPRFGVLTRVAIEAQLEETDIHDAIEALRHAELHDARAVARASDAVGRAIASSPFAAPVMQAVAELVESFAAEDRLVVRLSPVVSAAESTRLRGVVPAFIGLRGNQAVADAIQHGLAAWFAPAARTALLALGRTPEETPVAFLVQRYLDGEVQGVVASVESRVAPGRGPRVSIRARRRDQPEGHDDTFLLARGEDARAPLASDVAIDVRRALPGTGSPNALEPEEVRRIATDALHLEAALHRTLALEFVVAGRLPSYLNALPIYAPRVQRSSSNPRVLDDMLFPDAVRGIMRPLSLSVLRAVMTKAVVEMVDPLGAPRTAAGLRRLPEAFALVGSRPYLDLERLRRVLEEAPGGPLYARALGETDKDAERDADDVAHVRKLLRTVGRVTQEWRARAEALTRQAEHDPREGSDEDDNPRLACTERLVHTVETWTQAESIRLPARLAAEAFCQALQLMESAWMVPPKPGLVMGLLGGAPSPGQKGGGLLPLDDLVDVIRRHPNVLAPLRGGGSPEAVLRTLEQTPAMSSLLSKVLETATTLDRAPVGGARLEAPPYAARPELVLAMAASMANTPDATLGRTEAVRREADEAQKRDFKDRRLVLGMLSRVALFERCLETLRELVWITSRIDDTIARLAGRARSAALALGQLLLDNGMIDQEEDVLWMTLDELEAFARDQSVDANPRELLAVRKRDVLRAPPLPHRFTVTGSTASLDLADLAEGSAPSSSGAEWQGVVASAGEALGRAVVIGPWDDRRPAELFDALPLLADDSVVVVARLDFGLLPLLRRARAVVVESGSILDGCAAGLRAAGVPALVSMPGICAVIVPGERLLVDGWRGVLVRLDHSKTLAPWADALSRPDLVRRTGLATEEGPPVRDDVVASEDETL